MSINLLNWREDLWKKQIRRFYLLLGCWSFTAATAIALYNAYLTQQLRELSLKLNIATYKPAHHLPKDPLLKKWLQYKTTSLNLIQQLAQATPKNCQLFSLDIKKNLAVIKGKSRSIRTTLAFLNKIKKNGQIKQLWVNLSSTREKNNAHQQMFTIMFTIRLIPNEFET